MAVWYSLRSFGIFFPVFVCFDIEKSGNPDRENQGYMYANYSIYFLLIIKDSYPSERRPKMDWHIIPKRSESSSRKSGKTQKARKPFGTHFRLT
jgi:hypothetical protein